MMNQHGESMNKPRSIFSIPIFWMLLGPPAIRVVEDNRSGLSSLQGDQDIWNYIRIGWWLFFGTIAIIQLVRERRLLVDFLARVRPAALFVSLFLLSMLASTALSPTPIFTLANVLMIGLLVVAAIGLALRIYGGVLPVSQVLRYLLWTSVALLVFVSGIYLAYPQLVEHAVFGVRLRGESLAYTPLLSVVCMYIGTLFFFKTRGLRRGWYLVPIVFGLVWLLLGQTRSAYLGMAVGFVVIVLVNGRLIRNLVNMTALAVAGLVFVVSIGILYNISQNVSRFVDQKFERFIIRDYWALRNPEVAARSFATLNGRTIAASVLLEGVATHPFGFGYIGGVRTYMASPNVMSRLPDDAFIGAHNGFLEVLGGAGIFAFLGYIGFLAWVIFNGRRFKNPDALVVMGILFVLLVEGMFESEIAFPFHQSSVILWMMTAVIAASVAYEKRYVESLARPMTDGSRSLIEGTFQMQAEQ